MSRILVLSPAEPPADGIAKHTIHLLEAWDAAGHCVLVMAPGKQRSVRDAERLGTHSRMAKLFRQFPRRRTWNEALGFDPDMVFVQFGIAAMNVNFWSVRSLCKRFMGAGTPLVVGYHESAREYDLLGFVTRSMYKSIARVTSVAVAFSWAGREALTKNHLFDEVVEVPLGTSGVAAIADDDVTRVREKYLVRKPLVLTIGFTSADKGTDLLLDAAELVAKNLGGEVQFLIAGSPRRRRGAFRLMEYRDVRFLRRLESRAGSIPDADIAFTGFVDDGDINALLFAADVVVLPYRSITQSGIANLALASRAVVVCSDLPGLRSDLGDAAQYFPVGDFAAIAEMVSHLLADESASLRERMRELSEQRANANTYANVAEKLLSIGTAGPPTTILPDMSERQESERRAYDEDRVAEISGKWWRLFQHVSFSPNTQRAEALFDDLARESVTGGRALDICCGAGGKTLPFLDLGASYVLGVDLSESEIAQAKLKEQPGKLEFHVSDVSEPLTGKFELIAGHGALHHIDFRPILINLFQNNLAPGGTLLFEEPLGENLLTRGFHRFVHSAHTPGERPLRKDDIDWFLKTFPNSRFYPINYVSFPAALFSSLFLRRSADNRRAADNWLLRWADRMDQRLARIERLRSHFRAGIFVATTPAD